jgi:hypothetical protein
LPELPMLLHPLARDVRCPRCGGDLTFIRVRVFGDLYQCSCGGLCMGQVMHYQSKASKACGYAPITHFGSFGAWTACGETAAME